MRPSPTAGQASLEYIAVISLVAALLLVAAPAVGAPSLASSVARGIRIGLCVVAGDICTRADAAAAGLPPCRLRMRTKGYDERVTVMSVEIGSRDVLSGYQESDGSISLTWTGGVSAGLSYGFGLESPVMNAGVGGSARAKLAIARGWRFPDEATARRFVAGLPRSAADPRRWPAAWHTVEAGAEVNADVAEDARGVTLAGLGVSGADILGARIGPGATKTLYFNAGFEGVEATLPGLPSAGRGRGTLIGELTLDGGSPRALALRGIEPSRQNSRLTETVYRLNLDGRLPPPWELADRLRRSGTVERNVYAYADRTRGVSGSFSLGLKLFGADARYVDIRRTLIDATAHTGAGRERSRFDCLDQLR